MDDWHDDAYAAIYDEQDRERTASSNTTNSCCGIPFIFAVIGLILVIVM